MMDGLNIATRMKRFRTIMQRARCQAMLISNPANVYYLSGFSGEGSLLITEQDAYVLTDPRYTEQCESETTGFTCLSTASAAEKAELVQAYRRIGFESQHMTVVGRETWEQVFGRKMVSTSGLTEELRTVKDEEEIAAIQKAVEIGDAVFSDILAEIKPGVSEKALAISIEHRLKIGGCEKESFETIVVSGVRSSLPHGTPSDKHLAVGELLTMDFGGFYRRYAGDMTRTVAVGKSCAKIRSIYQSVLEAQMEAVAAVAPGKTCRQIDEAARSLLAKRGLDQYFTHSTGHGVGLDIHESPTVSARNDTILVENMVITVEPGVYIRGWGGVRIEDVVLVTTHGNRVLTGSTKDLLVI